MHSSELGPLLMARLAKVNQLPDGQPLLIEMREFVGVERDTVMRWLREPTKHPRGEKLNKLWHFLQAAGIDSPELKKLQETHAFGAYLGMLMAYGVITLEEAVDYCGLTSEQSALQVIRGGQRPVEPKESLEGLRAIYEEELDRLVGELSERLANLRSGSESTSSSVEVRIPLPPVMVSKPKAELSVPIQSESGDGNTDFILDLAAAIAQLHVKVLYALDALTSEEIALVRKYANSNVLFDLSNALNRMGSTRALNDGR